MEWLENNKIPIGRWLADFVDFLNDYLFWLFDGFTIALEYVFDLTSMVLLAIPAFGMIALIAGAAYWIHRSWKISLFIVLSLLLIINLGYWEDTMETLSLVLWATVLCVGIGVPVGIAAAHRPKLWVSIRPILDMMQTIPTFVYLIPALTLFGLGPVPGVVATVIFVVPAPMISFSIARTLANCYPICSSHWQWKTKSWERSSTMDRNLTMQQMRG